MTDKASSKLLTSKAKEIVYNVSEHFRNEGKGFLERTAEATWVGHTTVVGRRHKPKDYSHQRERSVKTTRVWITLMSASSGIKFTNFIPYANSCRHLKVYTLNKF